MRRILCLNNWNDFAFYFNELLHAIYFLGCSICRSCYYHLASRSFLSKVKRNFRYETGRWQTNNRQKAIEGLVRSIYTKKSSFIHLKYGYVQRKSNPYPCQLETNFFISRKTGVLMQDIEEEVTKVLGTKRNGQWQSHTGYEEQEDTRDYKHLEWNRRAK